MTFDAPFRAHGLFLLVLVFLTEKKCMTVFYRIECFPCVTSSPFFFLCDVLLSNVVLLRPPTLEVIDTFGTRSFISYPPILIFFFLAASLSPSLAS